jgi:hypothetical protein
MQSACSITRFDPEPPLRRLDFSTADHYTPATFRLLGSFVRSHYAVLHRGAALQGECRRRKLGTKEGLVPDPVGLVWHNGHIDEDVQTGAVFSTLRYVPAAFMKFLARLAWLNDLAPDVFLPRESRNTLDLQS